MKKIETFSIKVLPAPNKTMKLRSGRNLQTKTSVQIKIQENELEKDVKRTEGVFRMMVEEFEQEPENCDKMMHRVRMVTYLFSYANSLRTEIMNHKRMKKVKETMLKQCKQFSEEAKIHIPRQINAALSTESNKSKSPEVIREYYTTQANIMKEQLDIFTHYYG